MIPPEWARERRRVRDELRRLPPEMQQLLRRVRRDDVRAGLVTAILERARSAARQRTHSATVLAVDERAELRRLIIPSYLRWLRREIDRALRTAHLEAMDPGQPDLKIPNELPRVNLAPGSTWVPAEDVGLGIAALHDGPPEEWWAMAAKVTASLSRSQQTRRADGLDGFDEVASSLRTLVVNPGAGGFARAVAASKPPGRVFILELGSELSATTLRDVKRSTSLPSESEPFDLVVWPVPSPGVGGASNHGRIYDRVDSFGPQKWRGLVRDALGALGRLVNINGVLLVRLPLGFRVHPQGYVEAPHLLNNLLDDIDLTITSTIDERPDGRVSQPFVGLSRCAWRTIFFRRSPP